jgi:hypothetical protein
VSDSILYLAIVAIWAGFLIPAWIRRPHSSKNEQSFEAGEFETEIDPETGRKTAVGASHQAAASDAEGHFETVPKLASHAFAAAPTADLTPPPTGTVPDEVIGTNSEYRDDVHPHNYAPADPGPRHPQPGPSQSREQMLRARRRMLTILVGLTFATTLFAFTGLVQWWICVPPVAMLVLYVLLLREIAMADAELARKRHTWEAAQAQAAEAADWRREQERSEPEAPEPTAEIIDISSRVGDQFYDQYADAAVRAVGD